MRDGRQPRNAITFARLVEFSRLSMILLSAVSVLAQQNLPPQKNKDDAAKKPPPTCRVSGRVVAAADGVPLKSAHVVLVQENVRSHPKAFGATTDNDGHFEIKNVVADRYNFIASHTGYVNGRYQSKGNDQGAVLALKPGDEIDDAIFRLQRAGVIAGKITDENGEPLAKTMVTAERRPSAEEKEDEEPRTSRKQELHTSAEVMTDDRGEYRLFGLEPGEYYIKASESGGMVFGQGNETDWMMREALGTEYVPIYYPSVVSFDQAQAVAVRAGEEIEADIAMRYVPSVEVAGKVIGPDGRPPLHAWVHLEAAGVEEEAGDDFSASSDDKGEFSIKNVPPGSYVVEAEDFQDEKQWMARQKIEVAERKIDSLVLDLGRGSSITGRITFLGGNAPAAERVFLTLQPAGDTEEWGGYARPKKDGSFEIPDVPEGSYSLHVNLRQQGWYLKSARFGADNVLEKGVQVEKGSTAGSLEIVIASDSAQLEGAVIFHDKPAAAAQIKLKPDPTTPYNRTLIQAASTDQNGHFTITNIAPGKYQVTAKLPGDSGSPAATSEPKSITLTEKDRQSLQLTAEEPKPSQ